MSRSTTRILKKEWDAYLADTPVMLTASELLPDDERFMTFLQRVYRTRDPEMEEELAWYLFEEIGWPEGRRYCYDYVCGTSNSSFLYDMLRKERVKPIDPRLENRRIYWKRPGKAEFLSAHQRMLEILKTIS
jgi:hypothetical protein